MVMYINAMDISISHHTKLMVAKSQSQSPSHAHTFPVI